MLPSCANEISRARCVPGRTAVSSNGVPLVDFLARRTKAMQSTRASIQLLSDVSNGLQWIAAITLLRRETAKDTK